MSIRKKVRANDASGGANEQREHRSLAGRPSRTVGHALQKWQRNADAGGASQE
jgi:hypothetical protein